MEAQKKEDKLISESMAGIVVKYSIEKGFGFIRSDDKSIQSDIFVYFNQIVDIDSTGFLKLCQNQRVKFDLYLTGKGLVAKRVYPGEILEELFLNRAHS